MIDFLTTCNISNDTINKMKEIYNNDILTSLYINKDECIKIINFLKSININCIDDLLLNEIYVFLKNYEDVYDSFYEYDFQMISEIINKTYTVIEKIV